MKNMSKIRVYSKEEVNFILKNYKGISSKDLAQRFNTQFDDNVTPYQMYSFKKARKLRSGYRRPANVLFTNDQEQFIQRHYKGISSRELTILINNEFGTNFKMSQIQAYKKRKRLRSGYNTQFQKGQEPANKGLKWDDYLPKEKQEKALKTTFKKGTRPKNYRPVGSERITKDGYIEIKIQDPDVWETKHRIIWEKVHGPIPEGYRLMFLDGNRKNCKIDNLKLVPYAISAIMNKQNLYTQGDRELNEAGSLIAEIIHKKSSLKKT